MTHGEAWFEQKQKLQNADSFDDCHINERGLPPKMSKEDAGYYYNTKLFAYWMDRLKDNISIMKKKEIIGLFMFGHTDRHKLFKGKEDEDT